MLMTASPHWWVVSGERQRQRTWSASCEGYSNVELLHSLSYTHLDCGSESVLSFNSSSETSVSRISGLDLFPYLRHTKTDRQTGKGVTDYQAEEEFKGLTPNLDLLLIKWYHREKDRTGKQISEPIALQVLMSYLQLQAQWRMNTVRPRLCRGRQELYCRWSDFLFCLSDDKPPWRAFTTLGG